MDQSGARSRGRVTASRLPKLKRKKKEEMDGSFFGSSLFLLLALLDGSVAEKLQVGVEIKAERIVSEIRIS